MDWQQPRRYEEIQTDSWHDWKQTVLEDDGKDWPTKKWRWSLKVRKVRNTSNNDTSDVVGIRSTRFDDIRLFFFVYDTTFLPTFLLILPILTLTVITIRLIKAMKAHRCMHLEMQNRSQQNDTNVTFPLVIVVIVFIDCQVPTFFSYVLMEVMPID